MPNPGIPTSRSLNTALTGPCCTAIESSRVSVTGRTSALPVADPSQKSATMVAVFQPGMKSLLSGRRERVRRR